MMVSVVDPSLRALVKAFMSSVVEISVIILALGPNHKLIVSVALALMTSLIAMNKAKISVEKEAAPVVAKLTAPVVAKDVVPKLAEVAKLAAPEVEKDVVPKLAVVAKPEADMEAVPALAKSPQ